MSRTHTCGMAGDCAWKAPRANTRNGTAISVATALFVLGIWLAGCDQTPGLDGANNTAPYLFDFKMQPTLVVFEELPVDQIVADTLARVPMLLSVRAEDDDANLEQVVFLVRAPFSGADTYVTGQLTQAVGNRWDAEFRLDLPRGGVGTYDIVVFALDSNNRVSNQARGGLTFEVSAGRPPVIERIEAPETFTPPGTLSMVAVVSDPDGLNNIRQVLVTTPTGVELPMHDDGETQGDETARDGRYTVSFNVPEASPGPQSFRFRAIDRSGLVSDTVEKTITIVE